MRVLLINPPDDLRAFLGGGSAFISTVEPLGLLYIAAVAREAGHEVSVIDAFAEDLDEQALFERLERLQPDVVGLTTLTSNGGFVYRFGQLLRKRRPGMTVVLGNLHASVFADAYLRNGACDFVVHGEGEHVFLGLLEVLGTHDAPDSVPSLSFLRDGQPVRTSGPASVRDLDSLPFPARDLAPQHLYRVNEISNERTRGLKAGVATKHMMSSRGCPNRCTFCVQVNSPPRYLAAQRTVDEMELLSSRYGAGLIQFSDPLFTGKRQRVLDICREVRSRRLDVRWHCEGHVRFLDDDVLQAMESAGCVDVAVGIESGVQRLLDGVRKGIDLRQVSETVRRIKRTTGIGVTGLFILGLPGETPEETLQTIRFACELPLDQAQFSILSPYPGSALFDELRARGELDTGERPDGTLDPSVWKRYSAYPLFTDHEPIWVTSTQTGAGLKRLQRRALRTYYLRPAAFWTQLKRIRPSNLRTALKAFRDTFL